MDRKQNDMLEYALPNDDAPDERSEFQIERLLPFDRGDLGDCSVSLRRRQGAEVANAYLNRHSTVDDLRRRAGDDAERRSQRFMALNYGVYRLRQDVHPQAARDRYREGNI